MFHLALYEPEIPPNTGNIIRLCANTGATLHLIGPLGFSMDDRSLRRAGLDYHEYANVKTYASYGEFKDTMPQSRIFGFSTRGTRAHNEASFEPDDVLLFGPETRGLPTQVLDELPKGRVLRIPMRRDVRSLNLSNAVAVACYEAWRQHDFAGSVE
jgi:tRNA (cytidine/uridine-2'-O-)-methyltransferase